MSADEMNTPAVPEAVEGEPPLIQEVVAPTSAIERPEESSLGRVLVQVQRVLDEVEATPIVGDIYDWGRAIALGLKDTAEGMLDDGRRAARRAQNEAWRRFDDKTKYRRRK